MSNQDTITALKSATSVKYNDLLVIDDNGYIVSHLSQDMFLKNISGEAYIKQILSSGKESEIFIMNTDDRRYLYNICFIRPFKMEVRKLNAI